MYDDVRKGLVGFSLAEEVISILVHGKGALEVENVDPNYERCEGDGAMATRQPSINTNHIRNRNFALLYFFFVFATKMVNLYFAWQQKQKTFQWAMRNV